MTEAQKKRAELQKQLAATEVAPTGYDPEKFFGPGEHAVASASGIHNRLIEANGVTLEIDTENESFTICGPLPPLDGPCPVTKPSVDKDGKPKGINFSVAFGHWLSTRKGSLTMDGMDTQGRNVSVSYSIVINAKPDVNGKSAPAASDCPKTVSM